VALDKNSSIKIGTVVKYNPDQPRDSHGRFGSNEDSHDNQWVKNASEEPSAERYSKIVENRGALIRQSHVDARANKAWATSDYNGEISKYITIGNDILNQWLRYGDEKSFDKTGEIGNLWQGTYTKQQAIDTIKALDEKLASAPTDKTYYASRVISRKVMDENGKTVSVNDLKVGQIITDPAYQSTTLNARLSYRGAFTTPDGNREKDLIGATKLSAFEKLPEESLHSTELLLTIPEGVPALYRPTSAYSRSSLVNSENEDELLLGRGLKMVVTSVDHIYAPNEYSKIQTLVSVRVLPPDNLIPPFDKLQALNKNSSIKIGTILKYSPDQPRDDHGRFASGSGSGTPSENYEKLANGQDVTINREQLRPLLEHALTQSKNADLTNLHVIGAPLFDKPNLGISRADMPQVPSNMKPEFLAELEKKGIGIQRLTVDPFNLKPVQNEISADKSAQVMERELAKNGNPEMAPDSGRIIMSNDGYVLDGHHRWAAYAGMDSPLPAIKVDLGIRDLLNVVNAWNDKAGVQRLALGQDRQDYKAAALEAQIAFDNYLEVLLTKNKK